MALIDTINNPEKYINNYLEALDGSLNSNTFLLHINKVFNKLNFKEELSTFIKSEEFKQLMLKADIERNWFNYHNQDFDDAKEIKYTPYDFVFTTEFYKPDFQLNIQSLDYLGLKNSLTDLLLNKCIYHRWYSNEKMVNEIVDNFLSKLFSDNSDCTYFKIVPDFLITTEDLWQEDAERLCYFDGFQQDSCTIFLSNKSMYMLLTNGRA
ncbi:MAG: hypothetical protein CMO01_21540 [Thalassobius sp.]|nr:hypothetical protein [Thalassovita sp.]